MADSDSPPSPLLTSHHRSRRAGEHRKSHRSSKDREHAYLGGTNKELARLLVYEEKEARDLRNMVFTLTEQLKSETQRAEDAEHKTKEAVLRFKEANDARLAAMQDASRANEELNLYKLQLQNAQREIERAQELLDTVEAQRCEAEDAAARARTTARRLKEEKVAVLAKEEGRKQGIEEGMARGRALGYEEGRAAGYERGLEVAHEYVRRLRDSGVGYEYPEPPSPPPVRVTPPPVVPPSESSADEIISVKSPAPSRELKEPAARPVSAYSSKSGTRTPVDYPPLGWIPTIDNDRRIRLPPPHELAPAPPTPTPSPPAAAALQMVPEGGETPPLMVPPPAQEYYDQSSDSESISTAAKHRPRPRRRKSGGSESTTISQFDIVGPPVSASGRSVVEKPSVLSAISEASEREKSSSVSSPQGFSPYTHVSSPSFVMPSSRPDQTPAASAQNLQDSIYTRPHRSPPSRSQSRSQLSPNGSNSSDMGINISVEPPSRPDSHPSSPNRLRADMLSVEDAAKQQPPPTDPVAASQTGSIIAPLSALPLPLSLPPDGQFPPGFVPISGAIPSTQTFGGAQYTNPNTPAAIPLPPSTVPSVQRLYTNTPSVVGSAIGVPGGYRSTVDPVVIPLPPSTVASHSYTNLPSGRYSRAALHKDSESDEDDPVSSGVSSSLDTLTTPPARHIRPPTSAYAAAPVPDGVVYPPPTPRSTTPRMASMTSRAARVPLPPSTVGSPRSTYTRASRKHGSTSGSVVGR